MNAAIYAVAAGPESFWLAIVSLFLSVVFWTALILLARVAIVYDRDLRRLGSMSGALVGALFWTMQFVSRVFFDYVGPSVLVTRLSTFKDAVFAFGVLMMAFAVRAAYRERD